MAYELPSKTSPYKRACFYKRTTLCSLFDSKVIKTYNYGRDAMQYGISLMAGRDSCRFESARDPYIFCKINAFKGVSCYDNNKRDRETMQRIA